MDYRLAASRIGYYLMVRAIHPSDLNRWNRLEWAVGTRLFNWGRRKEIGR